MQTPFYDPNKTYEANYQQGPFGLFADTDQSPILRESISPEIDFCGNKIYQPFGIPAGPLLNSNYVESAFRYGFDLTTYKTVRSRKVACHPSPNVLAVHVDGDLTLKKATKSLLADQKYQQPLSITNSFGVPSMDPDIWQEDMTKAVKSAKIGQVMIGSFQGTKTETGSADDFVNDYVLCAGLVHETGARILEANLSCPNEGSSQMLCFDVDKVQKIAFQIKEKIGNTPLMLKLAYFESNEHLLELVKQVGPIVQGLVAINTIPANIVNKNGEQALPGSGRLRSGVCGHCIRWAGLEMVERLAELRNQLALDFEIVGVGGVMNHQDYLAYIDAGADAVQSATGAMWNPLLGKEVWDAR